MEVEISKVIVAKNRRTLRNIEPLALSIKEIGLINPITITGDYRLIAGLHRLEACKLLGWKKIPAIVTNLEGLKAELAEIDENLIRNDLTVLERGEEYKRRKEIYETLYPEAKAYSSEKQKQRRIQQPSEIISPGFSKDTATKINVTPRTVQQEVQIANKLSPEVKDILKDKPLADNKTELLKLARMEHLKQKEVVKKVVSDGARNIREAISLINTVPSSTSAVAELQQLIDSGKRYGTIYADPPWDYSNQGTRSATNNFYPTMSVDEIADLPISLLAADDAHLHLWTTNAFLFDSIKIIEAWGFQYKSCFVWCKPKIGIGNYWRIAHEFLLLGVRGDCKFFKEKNYRSWQEIPTNGHSTKPEEIAQIIERVSPGPFLEMFGRKIRRGWTVWGNEVLGKAKAELRKI